MNSRRNGLKICQFALAGLMCLSAGSLVGCRSNSPGGTTGAPGESPRSSEAGNPNASGAHAADLQAAATAGDARAVKSLLDSGADMHVKDELGRTPLHLAAAQTSPDTVRELVKKGANINAQDTHGETALMVASRKGSTACVKELLDGGADPNIKDSLKPPGWTALTIAVQQGHHDVMKLLLEKGADANYLHHQYASPLMQAAMTDDVEAIRILLAHGADPNKKDYRGITAIARAVEGRHRGAVEALLAGKADPNVRDITGQPLLKKARQLQKEDAMTKAAVTKPGSQYGATTRTKVAAQAQNTEAIVGLLRRAGAHE